MKRFILFTISLLSSACLQTHACGSYYPYGEDVRFNLLNPKCFNLNNYTLFNYTSLLYYYDTYGGVSDENANGTQSGKQANILLWQQRCGNKPTLQDIYETVYNDPLIIADKKDANSFIRYLSVNKDFEAIEYLNFAKSCEFYNISYDDPWERHETVKIPERNELIERAQSAINRLKDEDLKSRYAFLAIRLAYYDGNKDVIRKLYKAIFEKSHRKDIIYYWSTYFYCLSIENSPYRNYLFAQVFASAPDKRFMTCQYTDRKIPIAEVLQQTANPLEQSAIYLLYGVRNPAQGLPALQQIYENNPAFDGLDFLLLREVNKLEDWICSPYYTELGPSMYKDSHTTGWWEAREQEYNPDIMLQRSVEDRQYAREVLDFISKADFRKVQNPALWQTAKAYLLFMVGDYDAVLHETRSPWLNTLSPDALAFREKLEALTHTSRQQSGNAIILDPVKTALMKYDDDSRFIFAIGRELEFRNNTTDAALLYSKKSKTSEEYPDWDFSGVYWRTKQRHCTLYADYYTSYFFYMDAEYTPEQVEALLSDIQNNDTKQDAFSHWKYERITSATDRLYDLLGTKYMRQDNLNQALQAFQSVNDTLWNSDRYYYKDYLDANPFYTDFYTEHQHTDADTITYNKRELTEKIIDLLQQAANPRNKDRDYCYFLIGNAYFNMTQYGNSWMMKRYYWTVSATPAGLEDDDDYFGCLHAKNYYLKAQKAAGKNKRFAALCLRMAARCESYHLFHNVNPAPHYWSDDYDKVQQRLFDENKYYQQIAREYPAYYDDLVSNCESFATYLKTSIR